MMGSMMSGISGLRNHQTAMDVVGNNIANVNTAGFKASRILFSQVFSNTMANATAPNTQTGTGGTNPMQIGMGAGVSSIDMLYTEGNIERTDNPLDVSIDGNGLFITKATDSSSYTFTRAGAFGVDKNGNLITASGAKVCGWQRLLPSDDITEQEKFATTMDVQPINIYRDEYNGNKQILEPQPTTAIVLSGNLNANTLKGEEVGVPLTLYDNYGNEIEATMKFIKEENVADSNSLFIGSKAADPDNVELDTDGVLPILYNFDGQEVGWIDALAAARAKDEGLYVVEGLGGTYEMVKADDPSGLKVIDKVSEYISNKWTYEFTVNGETLKDKNGVDITGTATFTNSPGTGYGKLKELRDAAGNLIEDFKLDFIAKYDASPDNDTQISFDFSSVTQYTAKDSVYVYDSDGYTTGTLQEYSIGSDGIITGIYSNGKQKPLGVIALASFENYAALKSAGDSSYVETANSGEFRAVVPGDSAGSLTANTLEMSNVDLSTEFTNMIIYQRGFQANSRGITTADEMLQELVNLKR